jgi:hypothetical protein
MSEENNQSQSNSLEQAAGEAINEASQQEGTEEGSDESSDGQVIEASSEEGSEEASEGSVSKDFEDAINEANGKKEAKDTKEDKKIDKDAKKAADKVGAKKVDDKYTIKVDGETLELSKEEMVRYAQLGKAGQKKMQEAAEYKKQVNEFIQLLKNDPKAVLNDPSIGIDVVKFAQQILSEQLEEESKSPEQREQERLKAELEALRKEKKDNEEKSKKEAENAKMQQYENEISDKIIKIMEAGKLPNTPRYLRTVADIMLTAIENNLDISPERAASIAREEVLNDNKKLYENMSDEEFEDFLGPDLVKRIQKRSVKKIQVAKAAPPSKPAATGQATPKVEEAPKKMSLKDFQKLW